MRYFALVTSVTELKRTFLVISVVFRIHMVEHCHHWGDSTVFTSKVHHGEVHVLLACSWNPSAGEVACWLAKLEESSEFKVYDTIIPQQFQDLPQTLQSVNAEVPLPYDIVFVHKLSIFPHTL